MRGGHEESDVLAIEWHQDESSETEDFILVESRKKRERRRSIMLSSMTKDKKSIQENPGARIKKGRKPDKATFLKQNKKVKK